MLIQKKQCWGMAPLVAVMLLGFTVTTLQANVITIGCAATNTSCTLDELVGGGSIVIDNNFFPSISGSCREDDFFKR